MGHVKAYLEEFTRLIAELDPGQIEAVIGHLLRVRRQGGRLFFLGVGGSAANCSHAVNDARKLGGFEAYAPTDNVSELTARINDDGWQSAFAQWLADSRLCDKDAVFVFSVGGGDRQAGISVNLVQALEYCQDRQSVVLGVVGRDEGFTAQVADAYVLVPNVNPHHVTPHTESAQSLIWHLIISDPRLKQRDYKWESVS